ncbi:MAG: hypothetical protein K8Q91_00005, partial [Candidatus Vogelbacteria bacterium]|nr:hypothetical protein [Candidatus Vogelbacteria bacterium]
MANKLYIDRVRVSFLDPNTRTDDDLYGLWVGDDYDEVPVLISTEEKDIPKTIQMVIRYLLREEEHQALELI